MNTGIFNGLPLPGREPISYYDCGNGATMALYPRSCREEYEAVRGSFAADGFTLFQENAWEGSLFCCLKRQGLTVQLWYAADDGALRVTADPFTAPYQTVPTVGSGPVTLWQFEVDHTLIDCGMCYIVKNSLGHYMVIDSAHTYSIHDNDRIYEFLRQQTPSGEKIVIDGWFFSHGHVDHIGKFCDFLRYNMGEDVEIKGLYYNFVPNTHRDNGQWLISDKIFTEQFHELVEACAIPKIKLHTGQRFYLGDLQLDVLCTHEDVHPTDLANYNDSSVVLRMEAAGSVVMFPGDAGGAESEILCNRYPRLLKCDVMQVAHHGHFGCSTRFYELASAPVVLFPVTQIKYDEEFPRYEANQRAVALSKRCYLAANGTAEIPLPLDLEAIRVYPDETFEDFNGVYNLWGYEYTEEHKRRLYREYVARGGKPIREFEE